MYRISPMCPQSNHSFLRNLLTSKLKRGTESKESVTEFPVTYWYVHWLELDNYSSRRVTRPEVSFIPFQRDRITGAGQCIVSSEHWPRQKLSAEKRGYVALRKSETWTYAFYYKFSLFRLLSTGSRGTCLDLSESRWQDGWRKWHMGNPHNSHSFPWRGAARTFIYKFSSKLCRISSAPAFTLVSCFAYSSILKMEAISYSEAPVEFRRTALCYIPEDRAILSYKLFKDIVYELPQSIHHKK